MTQTLDNLRAAGVIDVIEYLERVPERLIPRKQELIDTLRAQQNEQSATGGSGADALLGTMSGNLQSRYGTLPRTAQRALRQRTAARTK